MSEILILKLITSLQIPAISSIPLANWTLGTQAVHFHFRCPNHEFLAHRTTAQQPYSSSRKRKRGKLKNCQSTNSFRNYVRYCLNLKRVNCLFCLRPGSYHFRIKAEPVPGTEDEWSKGLKWAQHWILEQASLFNKSAASVFGAVSLI